MVAEPLALRDPVVHCLEMAVRERQDLGARRLTELRQLQNLADLVERKPEALRLANESQLGSVASVYRRYPPVVREDGGNRPTAS